MQTVRVKGTNFRGRCQRRDMPAARRVLGSKVMRPILQALALGALLAGGAARADTSFPLDDGIFDVFQNDNHLGTEDFSFEAHGDSVLVFSHVFEHLPYADRVDSLEKHIALVVALSDFDLRSYVSNQKLNGQLVKRELVMSDTAYTSYREDWRGGDGVRLVRPPGRVFVIDPQVFTLFDAIVRSLHGKTYDTWPVTMLFLGERDTVIQGLVTNLGTETMQWGSKPVQTRKLRIGDTTGEFFAWVSPRGTLLRLTLPKVGLRVELQPPKGKTTTGAKTASKATGAPSKPSSKPPAKPPSKPATKPTN